MRDVCLRFWSLLVLIALSVPGQLSARIVNANEGERIESASSAVNLRTGHRAYSGRVTILHENIELLATAVLAVRVNGDVERFEAEGKPVRFKQSVPFIYAVKSGRAERMQYLAQAAGTEAMEL